MSDSGAKDRDKVKAGDFIRYEYKNDIGIAKLVDINGELCIMAQRSSDKMDVGTEILKLKEVTGVHLLNENEIKKQLRRQVIVPPYHYFYEFITRNGHFEDMDDLDKFYYRLTNKDKFRVFD